MPLKLLIIEDSEEMRDSIILCVSMRWPEWQILSATDGKTGIEKVTAEKPDLVILDLALPDCHGFSVLGEIRKYSDLPVLIVSVKTDLVDRVRGLEYGADDYVAKPFSHTELLARIRSVLRRSHKLESRKEEKVVTGGNVSIDLAAGRAYVGGKETEFSALEWKLLSFLVENAGRVMAPPALAANVWGMNFVENSTIKMCVRRLRQKLGDDTQSPHIIRSYRRRGYSFELKRRDGPPPPVR